MTGGSKSRSRSGREPTEKQLEYLERLFTERCHAYDLSIFHGLSATDASSYIEELREYPKIKEVDALIGLRDALSRSGTDPDSLTRSEITREIEDLWRDFAVRTKPSARMASKYASTCKYCAGPTIIGEPIVKVPLVDYWIHERCSHPTAAGTANERELKSKRTFKCEKCGNLQQVHHLGSIALCQSCGVSHRFD